MALSQHASPGTSAAFDYQFQRALYWLTLSRAGSRIGIETDDDVSVRDWSGALRILEQNKHSIRATSNPFSDRSVGLWKTLSIWTSAVRNGEVEGADVAFLLVTNKEIHSGLVLQLSKADTDPLIDACISELEEVALSPAEGLEPFISVVLAQDNRQALRRVIRACHLVDGSADASGAALLAEATAHLQIPAWASEQSDSVVTELLGWMHRIALERWQAGQPCWIARDHFVNELHAILDRRRRIRDRERAEHLLPVNAGEIGEHRGRPFVRQMHLVTDDSSMVDTAIRDFIRCGIEKSRLSSEGNIADEDWIAFEDELVSRWERIRSRVIRLSGGASEEDCGFQVLVETTEAYRGRLGGQDTDQVYLTSGTYHRLADVTKVGWHPRFRELLDEDS